jgi:1-acyl-sn-glycerol-3-phosphate acyltransferase
MLKSLSLFILKILGWSVETKLPPDNKYVIIAAFHTSNWDFPLAILGLSAMGLKFNWVGKDSLFKWPVGIFFKSIGGIPVDRSIHTGFIKKIANLYSDYDRLAIALAPEGTRSKTEYWKSGFYYIALEANVPIALGYLDYPNKKLGVGGYFTPGGDLEEDLLKIKEFYKNIKGKYPLKQGEIQIRKKA